MKPSRAVIANINVKRRSVEYISLWAKKRHRHLYGLANTKILVLTLVTVALSTPARATTIVVLRTPDQIVVAGDSLSGLTRVRDSLTGIAGETKNSACKIIRVGNVFFASSGIGSDSETGFDVREIARASGEESNGLLTLQNFERVYLPSLAKELNFLRLANPAVYQKQSVENGPSAIVFFGFESGSTFFHARGYGASSSIFGEAVSVRTVSAFDCPGDNCPVKRDSRIANVNFGSSAAILRYLAPLVVPEADLLTVANKLVELEITDNPSEVGGPIDILRVTKNGGCWIKHEKECGKDIPFCATLPTPKPKPSKPTRRRTHRRPS